MSRAPAPSLFPAPEPAARVAAPAILRRSVTIWTDGACSGNPGPGGWGAILRYGDHEKEFSGGEALTTNNRMEILAAIKGLEALSRSCAVEVVTDSRYLRDGATSWLKGWKARGWLTAGRDPVKNEDLWRRVDALCLEHRIAWTWVRGHNGHPMNERADELARAGMAPFLAAGR